MVLEDSFNHFVCTSTLTNGRLRCDLLSVVFIRLLLYMWLLARILLREKREKRDRKTRNRKERERERERERANKEMRERERQ